MADPITMGVIGGVLESILAGQAAEKEVEKKRAERLRPDLKRRMKI